MVDFMQMEEDVDDATRGGSITDKKRKHLLFQSSFVVVDLKAKILTVYRLFHGSLNSVPVRTLSEANCQSGQATLNRTQMRRNSFLGDDLKFGSSADPYLTPVRNFWHSLQRFSLC